MSPTILLLVVVLLTGPTSWCDDNFVVASNNNSGAFVHTPISTPLSPLLSQRVKSQYITTTEKLTSTHSSSITTTTTQLSALLRPDWLRRGSRIKRLKEEKEKIYAPLRERQKQLGVGKKYRCVNPLESDSYEIKNSNDQEEDTLIFKVKESKLNVYIIIPETETERNDPTNVIGELDHGEIVTAIGPNEGMWIEHDYGGWSERIVDGVSRLLPIDGDNQ